MVNTTADTPLPLIYVADPFGFRRRKTRAVHVGNVGVGGDHPVRVQSMTTTDTLDTQATVAQAKRLAAVGCEIVRITAPTIDDARNLGRIRDALRATGCEVPLVADIHFSPAAAMEAANHVEKVRINPGNFADSKRFAVRDYTDAEYDAEVDRIRQRFGPLVERCKAGGVSMRIGTNHGSLSDRIMNRFGDTPRGMVESALEFAGICREHGYHDLIFSMKSSNPKVMVQAYRLLAACLDDRGWDYPFHLGVTEAGNGQDGRIKSAIGIGALLDDGIGDTIRVSLTEDPEAEVPVAFALARRFAARTENAHAAPAPDSRTPFAFERHSTIPLAVGDARLGGGVVPAVVLDLPGALSTHVDVVARIRAIVTTAPEVAPRPDAIALTVETDADVPLLAAVRAAMASGSSTAAAVALLAEVSGLVRVSDIAPLVDGVIIDAALAADDPAVFQAHLDAAKYRRLPVVLSSGCDDASVATVASHWQTAVTHAFAAGVRDVAIAARGANEGDLIRASRVARAVFPVDAPPLWLRHLGDEAPLDLTLGASVALGAPLCDGIGDAVSVGGGGVLGDGARTRLAFDVLQAASARITRTEYVACPSCGRTLFDLQETTTRIQARTAHLKGVKIAIMGCIVNGPGEMADADFGYVGGAPGRVNLYVGRECVEKGVAQSDADDRLIDLIRRHGRWVDADPVLTHIAPPPAAP